jgi:hypothetical protein
MTLFGSRYLTLVLWSRLSRDDSLDTHASSHEQSDFRRGNIVVDQLLDYNHVPTGNQRLSYLYSRRLTDGDIGYRARGGKPIRPIQPFRRSDTRTYSK